MKTIGLEGRMPWAVVSEHSKDTTKGPNRESNRAAV